MRRWGCGDVGRDSALCSHRRADAFAQSSAPFSSAPWCSPAVPSSPRAPCPCHPPPHPQLKLTLGAAPWEPTFPCLASSPAPTTPPAAGNQAKTFPGGLPVGVSSKTPSCPRVFLLPQSPGVLPTTMHPQPPNRCDLQAPGPLLHHILTSNLLSAGQRDTKTHYIKQGAKVGF